jgi:hypothetical protein
MLLGSDDSRGVDHAYQPGILGDPEFGRETKIRLTISIVDHPPVNGRPLTPLAPVLSVMSAQNWLWAEPLTPSVNGRPDGADCDEIVHRRSLTPLVYQCQLSYALALMQ